MMVISQSRSTDQLNDRGLRSPDLRDSACFIDGKAPETATAAAGRLPGFFCETRSVTPPRPISNLLISALQYGQGLICPGNASLVSTSSWQRGQFTKKL